MSYNLHITDFDRQISLGTDPEGSTTKAIFAGMSMPCAAPTNNENRSATVHHCNAKALHSGLFSW